MESVCGLNGSSRQPPRSSDVLKESSKATRHKCCTTNAVAAVQSRLACEAGPLSGRICVIVMFSGGLLPWSCCQGPVAKARCQYHVARPRCQGAVHSVFSCYGDGYTEMNGAWKRGSGGGLRQEGVSREWLKWLPGWPSCIIYYGQIAAQEAKNTHFSSPLVNSSY